jgi:hypothetical protein
VTIGSKGFFAESWVEHDMFLWSCDHKHDGTFIHKYNIYGKMFNYDNSHPNSIYINNVDKAEGFPVNLTKYIVRFKQYTIAEISLRNGMKHGPCTIYILNSDGEMVIFSQGYYENNRKVGLWIITNPYLMYISYKYFISYKNSYILFEDLYYKDSDPKDFSYSRNALMCAEHIVNFEGKEVYEYLMKNPIEYKYIDHFNRKITIKVNGVSVGIINWIKTIKTTIKNKRKRIKYYKSGYLIDDYDNPITIYDMSDTIVCYIT